MRSFSRRPFAASSSGLAWVGLSIAVGYLLLHAAFDALFLAVWGFPPGELPFWQSDGSWTDLVNAAMIGYLPAAQAMARRGVERDLAELRPRLRCNDAEFVALSDAATGPGRPIARALSLSGLALGALLIFVDPSASGGERSNEAGDRTVWL